MAESDRKLLPVEESNYYDNMMASSSENNHGALNRDTSCNWNYCYNGVKYFWRLPDGFGDIAQAQKYEINDGNLYKVEDVCFYLYNNGSPNAYSYNSKISVYSDANGLPGTEIALIIIGPSDYVLFPDTMCVDFAPFELLLDSDYWVAIESLAPDSTSGIRTLSDAGGGSCINSWAEYNIDHWELMATGWGSVGTNWNMLADVHVCSVSQFVDSVLPEQNAISVINETDLYIAFDTAIAFSTLNNNTILVHASQTGLHSGTISYDEPTRTATFDPDEDFAYGEVVTVTLTNEIESTDGIPLRPYSWQFTIKAAEASMNYDIRHDYNAGDNSHYVSTGDIDGDGDLDLIAANVYSKFITIYANDGAGTFTFNQNIPTDSGQWCAMAADYDNDGDIDIAATLPYKDTLLAYFNNGTGVFTNPIKYRVGDFCREAIAADLNNDGFQDIITVNAWSDNISVLINNKDGSFASQITYAVGDSPYSGEVADIDNDGDMDIITSNSYGDNVSILLNNGDATFASQITYPVGDAPRAICVCDLNADNFIDLVIPLETDHLVTILLNDTDGTFTAHSSFSVGLEPYAVICNDFDGDGDMDIAISIRNTSTIEIYTNDGIANFTFHSSITVGQRPQFMLSADLDNDGQLDMVSANWLGGNISVLYNYNCIDSDNDGYGDPGNPTNDCPDDNCPDIANANQLDSDSDGAGDVCDICPNHPEDDCCNPTVGNHAPEVISPFIDTLVLGKTFEYVFSVEDSDCDGTELTVDILNLPSWCSVSNDTISGFVDCNEVDTSFNVRINDGTIITNQAILLVVNDTLNRPHIIPPDDTILIEFHSDFAFYPDIIDPDDSEFVITYTQIPHWCTIRNDSLVGFPPDTVYIEPITVIVEDACHADTMTIQTQIFLCGDFGGDGILNLLDILFVIDYKYNNPPGPAPDPLEAGDVNHDGNINLLDILYLIDYIYGNPPGPEPQCPE